MCAAFTTAAVINHSVYAPKEAVSPLLYMPSQRENAPPKPHAPPEELQAIRDAFMAQSAQLAYEMKQGSGPLYDRICLHKTPDA
jgi:hypothetical protein